MQSDDDKAARKALQLRKLEAEVAKLDIERRIGELRVNTHEQSDLDDEAAIDRAGVYMFDSAVNGSTVAIAIATLGRISRRYPAKPLKVIFNSPGGSVIDGFALYDYLQELRAQGHHLTTVSLGWSASMAGILLQAGDERVAMPNSYVLIHELATAARGKTSELRDEMKFIERLTARALDILALRSTMTQAEISERWDRRDWWLDAEESLRLGFVDSIQTEPAFESTKTKRGKRA